MNIKLMLAIFVAFLAVPITSSAQEEMTDAQAAIARRLNRIDLHILLEQYKKVATALAEMELQERLSKADGSSVSEKEQESLMHKRGMLQLTADELRIKIQSLGPKAYELRALKKAKAEKKTDRRELKKKSG